MRYKHTWQVELLQDLPGAIKLITGASSNDAPYRFAIMTLRSLFPYLQLPLIAEYVHRSRGTIY